jgi:hypothetical protein
VRLASTREDAQPDLPEEPTLLLQERFSGSHPQRILSVESKVIPVKAQGWYRDPYGLHEDRYFSAGQPTKLVRDGGAESYDPPPPRPSAVELVEVTPSPPTNGSDLRRADEMESRPWVYDKESRFWAILDGATVYGPAL